MTRDEFKKIVAGMKHMYPFETFIPTKEAFDLWYSFFRDDDYAEVTRAVHEHIATSTKVPTVADIRARLTEQGEINEQEAWALVTKAIRNSGYNSQREFDRLPETVKRAVGSPANLKELALMPIDTVQSVEKSHFIRVYRTEVERAKSRKMIPGGIKQIAERTLSQLPG